MAQQSSVIRDIEVACHNTGLGGMQTIRITFGQGVTLEIADRPEQCITLLPQDWEYIGGLIRAASHVQDT